jgi:sterol 3beta-glucosyltransferase
MESQQPQGVPSVITCLTIGSRGDVQPYIALCKQLQKNGAHRCRIATHEEYRHWIEHHGIEFKSIGGNPQDLMTLCIENNFLSISFIKNGSKFVSRKAEQFWMIRWS